ncbi:MAG TPA: GNAT family N-acetyltransferase [Ktedonobacteraceae bacterium]|nr:GNAT family N-acetyltransferase [Ktedonobacteraceae bacterium]
MQESTHTLIYRRLDLQSDLAALFSLLHEIAQTDQTGEQLTEASLHEQLTWSGQDPALNNRVVALPDRTSLVGYGIIQKTSTDANADLYIAVHPSWRCQGIGSQLFSRLLERAFELDTQALRAYAPAQNEGAKLFVRKQGFEPVSTFTRLGLRAIQSFPDPALPQGFTVRSYDQIERVDLYTEALNRSYEGYWGHLQCTTEEVTRFLPHLNHAGIFLLFAPDGTIAGTCRATINEPLTGEHEAPTALIDAPGIVAQYRGAYLALPLLLTAIHWLLSQRPAMLEIEAWGEAPDTLEIYRSLGFTTTKEEISYRRSLK